jgi:hypothetical protein
VLFATKTLSNKLLLAIEFQFPWVLANTGYYQLSKQNKSKMKQKYYFRVQLYRTKKANKFL